MAKVRGEDVVIYIQEIGNSKCAEVLGCARSITFDIQQDMIETSITGNGRFRTYVPGAGSVTATLEGLVSINLATQKTITGVIERIEQFSIPPLYGFLIDIPDLCLPVGGTITVTGTTTADGDYTVLNYGNDGSGTGILVNEFVPAFTTTDGSITYNEYQYSIERMYDALIAGEKLLFEFYEQDTEGNFLRKTFYGYIQSISEIASFDNIATYTANITATGLPIIEYG